MIKLISLFLTFCLATSTPVARSGKCHQTPLAASSNDFGFQLYNQLTSTLEVHDNENVFISPLSIYAALSLTHRGAGGRTAEQLEKVLKLKENQLEGTKLQESFQKLLFSFAENQDDYSLLVANALFAQDGFHFNSKYLEDVHKYYLAALKLVDFQHNGEAAKNAVNEWVAENTKHKIESLLSEPLNPNTVLAILNAVYFKGTWKKEFDKKATKEGVFVTGGSAPNKIVKFMTHPDETFMYYYDRENRYKFLELPYKGEDVAMLIALPKDVKQEADLEMTSSILCRVTSGLKNTTLKRVKIPKFKIEYKNELSNTLSEMGIQDLFSPAADLTGISSTGGLQVSQVIHKAVVDVNEEGSEAAAVTSVIVEFKSLITPPNEFVANHPFLFYIIDKRSGLVLFNGRVVDP